MSGKPTVAAALPAELPRDARWRAVLVGIGAAGAAAADGEGPLVIVGTCGALHEGVRLGSFVLPEGAVASSGGVLEPDVGLRRSLRDAARRCGVAVAGGLVAEAAEPVDSPEDRRDLSRRSGAAWADAESARLGARAQAAGRPWAVLRFVSDTPERSLDWLRLLLGGWPTEQPGAARLARGLTAHPGCAGPLLRLGAVSLVARRRLASVLGAWRDSVGPRS